MSNNRPKLTLETWAALDAAASPGPWVHIPETDGGEAQVLGPLAWPDADDPAERIHVAQVGGAFDSYTNANAELMAASREAPTRLLAALRGLLDEMENGDCPSEGYARRLRHLIEQTDLAAPEQAQ